jgi:hypothetical protein
MRKAPRRPYLLPVLALLALVPAGLAAQDEAPIFERQYEVRFLRHFTAMAIAQNQCPPEATPKDCRITVREARSTGSIVAVLTDGETHRRIAHALAERDVPPRSQAFQVTLLHADRSGGGTPSELPAAIAKAMEDVRPFLPYSGYRVLDAAFLRTTEDGAAEVNGPEGRPYHAELSFTNGPAGSEELFVHRFVLVESPGAMALLPPPAASGSGASETTTPAPRASHPVLTTSFAIAPGETVVVGTSRIGGGDSALVVLVTALP